MTDATLTGWGAVCQGRPAHGTWTEEQRGWHINRLELLAFFLALHNFSRLLNGRHVLVRMDNTTVVLYLNHQGGLSSRPLCRLARNVCGYSADSEQVYVDLSGSRPGAPELRSRHALETEPGGRGMEAAPSNGELHMASVWLIHVEHDYALVFDYDYGFPNPPHRPWDWTL